MYVQQLRNVYTTTSTEVTEKGLTYDKIGIMKGSYTPPLQLGLPGKATSLSLRGYFIEEGCSEKIPRRPERVTRDRLGLAKLASGQSIVNMKQAYEDKKAAAS